MTIAITPLSAAIGAEVTGVDLRQPLPAPLLRELQALIDARHLLSFPGQGLDADEQVRFTAQFGPVTSDGSGGQLHAYISNRRRDSAVHADAALLWHSDNAWSPAPTHYIALGGHRVIGHLAPTTFASAVRAARVLPADLRLRIEGLRTINLADLSPAPGGDVEPARTPILETRQVLDAVPEDDYFYPRASYPVIWPHPRTSDELLTVSEDFSVCIEGMTPAESEAVYAPLFEILYDARHIYHHHWRQDDLVIWDNLVLQHGRPAFHGADGERTLLRTTINPDKAAYLRHARRVADYSETMRRDAAAPS